MTATSSKKYTHLIYGLFSFAISCVMSSWAYKYVNISGEATGIIVTVFSILAGFIIAIMTLSGEQLISSGSWRIAFYHKEEIEAGLFRQKLLFYLYLATLFIIFITALIKGIESLQDYVIFLERIYFGLAVFAFLLSFKLPSALQKIQLERIEAHIEQRRKKNKQ